MHQATIRVPPKAVFDFLCDPSVWEECTDWRVVEGDGRFGEGFTWQERRRLTRRTWTVTAFDRRGLTFTAESGEVTMTFRCKKGGTGSCNAQMRIEGEPKAVARFEKSDGDRLERFRDWLEG